MKKDISVIAFICMMFASGCLATSASARQPEIQLANKEIAQNSNGIILNSSQDRARENLTAEGGHRQANGSRYPLGPPLRREASPIGQGGEPVTKILIILGLISGAGALGWYLSRVSKVSSPNFVPGENSNSNKALLDRVSPRLRRKLLRLVNDPKTANRLLAGIHKHNRDRSANWLAEKAIYDLQRGR